MSRGSSKRRPSKRLTTSELRRRRRIRWALGTWVLLIFIAAVAYAIKKQIDRAHEPATRTAPTTIRP